MCSDTVVSVGRVKYTWCAENHTVYAFVHFRQSAYRMPMCLCICHDILGVCEHDTLQITSGSFTKFTTLVQLGTKMTCLDFGQVIEGQGDNETNMVKKSFVQKCTFLAKAY